MAASKIHPSAFPSQSGHTNVAVYARVSTHNGQDPGMQTREVEEYCQRRGWTIAGTYVDVGISGSKPSRPELDRQSPSGAASTPYVSTATTDSPAALGNW
jgi:hypothetical protein